jgi:hypothetical protein
MFPPVSKIFRRRGRDQSHQQKGVGLRHILAKGVGISDGGCLLEGAFAKVQRCSTHVMGSDPRY